MVANEMEKAKFIGAACGEKEGKAWFMVFIARWSEKYKSYVMWSSTRVEQTEYAEIAALKFGDDIFVHYFGGVLKDYSIVPAQIKK